jgi:hypothetical protein
MHDKPLGQGQGDDVGGCPHAGRHQPPSTYSRRLAGYQAADHRRGLPGLQLDGVDPGQEVRIFEHCGQVLGEQYVVL